MGQSDVVCVVGSCAPERSRIARGLAQDDGRVLLVSPYAQPASFVAAMLGHTDGPHRVVAELHDWPPVAEVIGELTDTDGRVVLSDVVCVVDALHLLDDLHRETYVRHRAGHDSQAFALTAHALLTVTQIEFASVLVVVNWTTLSTPELSRILALLSHLSPQARLRLDAVERNAPVLTGVGYESEQDRAGWLRVLNGAHDPAMRDARVSAVRYESIRPMHPGRLAHFLNRRLEPGEFGTVVRSAGFCRLATRAGYTAGWDHVGRTISIDPLRSGDSFDEEPLALGQDLAFIGIDLDAEGLRRALDEVVVTDGEIAAGPESWSRFADPFPSWERAVRSGE